MKTAAIYPITSHNKYLLKALNGRFRDYQITTAIIPNAFSNNIVTSDYFVRHKIEDIIGTVDAVIVINSWDSSRMYNEIIKVLSKGIDVITTIAFKKDEINFLSQIANENATTIKTAYDSHIMQLLNERDDVYSQPESIVICISTITKGIATSGLTLSLAHLFEQSGYAVGIISTDSDLQLVDICEWLPINDMISDNLDRCIMRINSFINLFQIVNKPDILILQLPDEGLYRMTYDFVSCFGAKTFLISQAVDFDYGIVLSPIIDSDPMLYKQLSDVSKSRFGFEYNSVCLVPKTVNLDIAQGEEIVKYYTASFDDLKNTVATLQQGIEKDINFLSIQENPDVCIRQHIVNCLS